MVAIKVGNVRYSLAHIVKVEEKSGTIYICYDFAVEEGQYFDALYGDDATKFLELYDKYMNTLEQ